MKIIHVKKFWAMITWFFSFTYWIIVSRKAQVLNLLVRHETQGTVGKFKRAKWLKCLSVNEGLTLLLLKLWMEDYKDKNIHNINLLVVFLHMIYFSFIVCELMFTWLVLEAVKAGVTMT